MSRICIAVILLSPLGVFAETFVLRGGGAVNGKLLGMDSHEVTIEHCGSVERFAREDVTSIRLESSPAEPNCDAAPASLELPQGTSLSIRLLDFVDSRHEPSGQVFRAMLEAPVKAGDRIALSSGARAIVRMIDAGSSSHPRLMLEIVGVQLARGWARIDPAAAKDSFIGAVDQISLRETPSSVPDGEEIILEGQRIYIPSNTVLTLTFRRAIRLEREGKRR
jgi:hypothetical protein